MKSQKVFRMGKPLDDEQMKDFQHEIRLKSARFSNKKGVLTITVNRKKYIIEQSTKPQL